MQRPGLGEPETHLDLRLAREVKGNKGFCKHINSRRRNRENVGQMLSEAGTLETQDMQGVGC